MHLLHQQDVDRGRVMLAHTTKSDGDLSPSTVAPAELARRRVGLVPHDWVACRQVHSDRVVTADAASPRQARPIADALVTRDPALVLAVHSGDCVPLGFVHAAGAVGVAHAGWQGLLAGVIESTVRTMRAAGGTADVVAVVGPHIRGRRYEFGARELDRFVQRFDESVVCQTDEGTPALDLSVAVAHELRRLDVEVAAASSDCTAEQASHYWSHRARGEHGRIALVGWLES